MDALTLAEDREEGDDGDYLEGGPTVGLLATFGGRAYSGGRAAIVGGSRVRPVGRLHPLPRDQEAAGEAPLPDASEAFGAAVEGAWPDDGEFEVELLNLEEALESVVASDMDERDKLRAFDRDVDSGALRMRVGGAALSTGDFCPEGWPMFSQKEPQPVESMADMQAGVSAAIAGLRLLRLNDPSATLTPTHDGLDVGAWSEGLRARCLDSAAFVAGRFRHTKPAWERLFDEFRLARGGSMMTRRERRALAIIGGVEMPFRHPRHAEQEGHPRRRKIQGQVTMMVGAVLPAGVVVAEYLDSEVPRPLLFPNAKSCFETPEDIAFVDDTVRTYLDVGAICTWPEAIARFGWRAMGLSSPEDGPTVVSSLGVVRKKYPPFKRRLVVDLRYVNYFCKYKKFKMAGLPQALRMLRLLKVADGDGELLASVVDDCSGYHHFFVQCRFLKYQAVAWKGVILVFLVLTFGYAPAVGDYSCVKDALYGGLLRSVGLRCNNFIDDAMLPHRTQTEGQRVMPLFFKLATHLGWCFGWGTPQAGEAGSLLRHPTNGGLVYDKVELLSLIVHYLGLKLDLRPHMWRIQVPEVKLRLIMEEIDGLVARAGSGEGISYKEAASIIGKVLSVAPAFIFAPTFMRSAYLSLVGAATARWRGMSDAGVLVSALVAWRSAAQLQPEGAPLSRFPLRLVWAGDASETAMGGLEVFSELGEDLTSARAVAHTGDMVLSVGLPEAVVARMSDPDPSRRPSSTLREILACVAVVRVICEQHGPWGALWGAEVEYRTDSQALEAVINNWNSAVAEINEEVVVLVLLQLRFGFRLRCVWYPRTDADQQRADDASKVMDFSEWWISDEGFAELAALLQAATASEAEPGGRRLSADAFACSLSARCSRFMASHWCPGVWAVDAYAHGHLLAYDPDRPGRRGMVLMNGPFGRMDETVELIWRHRIDCLLVYPCWPQAWWTMLELLPIIARGVLTPRRDLFRPGPRNSRAPRRAAYWPTHYAVIVWGELDVFPDPALVPDGTVGAELREDELLQYVLGRAERSRQQPAAGTAAGHREVARVTVDVAEGYHRVPVEPTHMQWRQGRHLGDGSQPDAGWRESDRQGARRRWGRAPASLVRPSEELLGVLGRQGRRTAEAAGELRGQCVGIAEQLQAPQTGEGAGEQGRGRPRYRMPPAYDGLSRRAWKKLRRQGLLPSGRESNP